MDLKNKTVLISGANRGIGRALAEAALARGARKVYAASRNGQPGWSASGLQALQLDVTDERSVKKAADIAQDVQILINNAGVLDFGNLLEASLDSFERLMNVNLWGNLRMDRAFLPALKRNGEGAIVNILTLVSLISAPGMAAYCASKAAAYSLALSLRASLAENGLRVLNVFPGAIDTDMLAGVEMAKTAPAHVAAEVFRALEQGREDVFPDPMSESVYAAWRADHKSVEKQFASM
ncbi:MAG: SDR family NAD(P)-dependent oxidoreductase [Leptospirales bacterium]|nr:SDR family NAD(P)-dependent oxidoreductase [Leptospirales bacterium]